MATNTRRTAQQTFTHRDHYTEVTNQVIAALEAGTPPWRRPWDRDKAGGPAMPCNAATGARYHGINVIVLGMSPLAFASGDPRWITYKQAADRGWQVQAGSRSVIGYFYKRLEVRDTSKPDDADATRRIPLLRTFNLFHASQIDGIPPYVPPTVAEAPWRAPEAAQTILTNSKAVIRIGGDSAFYSPTTDHIQLPPMSAFASPGSWSSTALHEAAHWTGHATRLNRDLSGRFGSIFYSQEELRAELASCFISAEMGIEGYDFTNNVAYLHFWLSKLRSDRKEIFRAAADAQRIADYLLAFHPAYAARNAPGADTPATTTDSEDTSDYAAAA